MRNLAIASALTAVLSSCTAPADPGVGKPRTKAASSAPSFATEGFGASVTGGQGRATVHVTNCNNGGAGSLREALLAGNRTVVFDQPCTINATAHLMIEDLSNITVDGCSAPSPGITIEGAGGLIVENSSNVILRCLRQRNSSDDSFAAFNSTGVVFDRLSAEGFADGGIDVTDGSTDVTIQWCIVTDYDSGDTLGSLVNNRAFRVTYHHNILASSERNPLCKVDDSSTTSSQTMCDIRNNVVWNWGANRGAGYGYGVGVDRGGRANVINNFFQASGAVSAELGIELNHAGSNAQAYTRGNLSGNGADLNDNGNVASPFTAPSVTTHTAAEALEMVLQYAGCPPLDAVDRALVDAIRANANPRGGDSTRPGAS